MRAQRIAHPILWLELRLTNKIINVCTLLKYVRVIRFRYALVAQFHFSVHEVQVCIGLTVSVRAVHIVSYEFTLLSLSSSGLFAVSLSKHCTVVKKMLYRVLCFYYV